MEAQNNHTDPLKELFSVLPEKDLPASFRQNVMQAVQEEAARAAQRNERLWLFATIAIACVVLALGIFALSYLNIPAIEWQTPDLSSFTFYLFIGSLAFILLICDYKFRKQFNEKHQRNNLV